MPRAFLRHGLLAAALKASLQTALRDTEGPIQSDEDLQSGRAHGQFCTPPIVEEVAHILTGNRSHSGEGLCEVGRIAEFLSTPRAEVQRAFESLGLAAPQRGNGTGHSVTCAKLCKSLEEKFKGKLPRSVDVACHLGCASHTTCIDVSETRLVQLFKNRRDHPNSIDGDVLTSMNRSQTEMPLTVKQPVRNIAMTAQHSIGERQARREEHLEPDLFLRLAAVFHMFVRLEPRQESHGERASAVLLEVLLSKRKRCADISGAVAVAESLVAILTKQVYQGNAGRAAEEWFGRGASDEIFKKELLRIMKSVHTQIRKLQPVYPGPFCKHADLYAYVADRENAKLECSMEEAKNTHCVQTLSGEPFVYLCDSFFDELDEDEQIGTLLHEASHLADSYTKDVCMDEFSREAADIFLAVPAGTLGEEPLGTFFALEPPANAPKEHLMMHSGTEAIAEFWGREEGPDGSYELLVFYPQSSKPYGTSTGCKHVAYGRQTCQELAMLSPRKAIRNADNFAFFITDFMSSLSPAPREPMGCSLVGDWCVGDRVTLRGHTPGKGVVQFRTPTLDANFSVGQQVWVRDYNEKVWQHGTISSTTPALLVTVDGVASERGNIRTSLSEGLMVAFRSDDGHSHIAASKDLFCGDLDKADTACRGMLDPGFGNTDT